MKILILTQWFEPEPTFKGLAFAKALAAKGHEVEVLTGFPNYPEGRLYSGYKIRPFKREVVDGISIIRVALYPSHDGSAIRRVVNYVSFALSAAVFGPFLVGRADVAYVYHPPPTVGLPAIALKWLRGIPFVYDIQDMWPDTLVATGMVKNRVFLALVGLWCKSVYAQAARIVVLSPGFKRTLVERGVPSEKIEVIYNWCDEANIHPVEKDKALAEALGMNGKFNVVFAGTMGKAQDLDTVLAAAELIRDSHDHIQIVLVGGGTEVQRLKDIVGRRKLTNVRFLPRRPYSEIARILALADVLLVILKGDPLFEITVPSKIQVYLAVGRPILAAVRGDGADLVREARAGVCVSPENPTELAAAVAGLACASTAELEALGDQGRAFYRENLSLKMGVKRFEKLLRVVAGEQRWNQ